MAALLRQAGQIEDQDAAGVAGCLIAIDIGAVGILDLNAGDIESGARIADDDVLRLADIDAGVGGADGFAILDQDIARGNRIKAISAIGLGRAVGPFGAQIAKGDGVRTVGLDGIALGVLDGKAFQQDTVGGDEQAFAAGGLVLEGEDRSIGAGADDRHIVHVEREAGGEPEGAGRQAYRVARCRKDERFLEAFESGCRIVGRRDVDVGGMRRADTSAQDESNRSQNTFKACPPLHPCSP